MALRIARTGLRAALLSGLAVACLTYPRPAGAEDAEVTPCCAVPQCLAEIPGAAEEAGFSPYSIRLPGAHVVAYGTEDRARGLWLEIVETCDTGEQMLWSRPLESGGALAPQALQALMNEMLDGDAEVTLAQIASRLAAAGETTEIRRAGYESCGCRLSREG